MPFPPGDSLSRSWIQNTDVRCIQHTILTSKHGTLGFLQQELSVESGDRTEIGSKGKGRATEKQRVAETEEHTDRDKDMKKAPQKTYKTGDTGDTGEYTHCSGEYTDMQKVTQRDAHQKTAKEKNEKEKHRGRHRWKRAHRCHMSTNSTIIH